MSSAEPVKKILCYADTQTPLVHFVIGLPVGSYIDPVGKKGALAMMMEMLFRGTRSYNRRDFQMQLEQRGSHVSVAVTSEVCWIKGECLASYLAETFALVVEAITAPRFAEDELKLLVAETSNILVAQRDDDEDVAEYFLRRLLYHNHPLEASPSGEVPNLATLEVADLQAVHQIWCQDLVRLGFAGDLTATMAQEMGAVLLAQLPQKPPPHLTPVPISLPSQSEIWLIDKPNRTQAQLRVGIFGTANSHQDRDAFWLGIVAFGGTFTSPLCQEVRDKRGWSYTASAETRRRSRFQSPVVLRTAPKLDDSVDCLELQFDLVNGLTQGQLASDCVTRARDYILGRAPFQLATVYDTLAVAISAQLMGNSVAEALAFAECIGQIALTDIPNQVAKSLQNQHILSVICGAADTLAPKLQQRFPDTLVKVLPYRSFLAA